VLSGSDDCRIPVRFYVSWDCREMIDFTLTRVVFQQAR